MSNTNYTGPIQPKVGYNKDQFMAGPVLLGKPIVITMPNGEKHKAQFAIVELADIIASHNEKTFSSSIGYPLDANGENINDRNYAADKNSQAKVVEFAQNLEPERVISTSRTPSGTPIITVDGIVVSGNNRTMSMKLALDQFSDKYLEYLQFLQEEIVGFGFDQSIGTQLVMHEKIALPGSSFNNPLSIQFNAPVLVRIDYDFSDYNTVELSKYNADTKKSERAIDKAIKLGKMLKENDTCSRIIADIVGNYETFSDFYANKADQKAMKDAMLNCDVLTSQGLPAIYDNGQFTDQGKDLIEAILAGMILGTDALNATNDGGARALRQTIITSLPVLIANKSLGQNSLIDQLNDAILLQAKIKNSGLSFQDYIMQQSMFDEKPTEYVLYLNRLFDAGLRKFKNAIENYNLAVLDSMQSQGMFGAPPTQSEIFEGYIKNKVDADDKMLIESVLDKNISSSASPVKNEIKKIKPAMAAPVSNPFVNGSYFQANPDKILAKQTPGTSRWKKPITIYTGSLDDLARIDALENFIEATAIESPTVSVVVPSVSKATETDTQVIDNLTQALKKSEKDTAKKAVRKVRGKQSIATSTDPETEIYSIDEVFNMLNPEVSVDELRAFLWYKNSIGRPITNPDWLALANMSQADLYNNKENLMAWVNDGLLYYYNGQLLPAYLYLAENVYDKKNRLEVIKTEDGESSNSGADAAYIIKTYGQQVLDNQLAALNNVYQVQYDKRLVIQGEGEGEGAGLIISPVSKFAKDFKIKSLIDGSTFKWKKISAASNKQFGKPDFLATGVTDKAKSEFPELSLTDAFSLWLVTDNTIQYKRGMNYADLIKVYIQAKSKPATSAIADEEGRYTGEQLVIKKKEDAAWERLKSKAKEESDRLFMKFLSTQLTLNDKVRIEMAWNRQFNGYVPINYNKVPVAFRANRFDMGQPMEIKPEKREAVAFVFSEGSGLLAYDVGVGKTPSAIFTISNFLDSGYAKRPILVVPNQTYKQWISEFKKFAAHIPINEFYNLSSDYIEDWRDMEGKTKMVPAGSVSIITYEGMRQLGFTENTQNEIKPELGNILLQFNDMEGVSDKKADRAAEKLESAVEKLIGKALAKTVINIEDLGFDFVLFDEAHANKKVFTFVKGQKEENLGNSGKDTKSVNRYELKSGEPSFNGVKSFMICHYMQKYYGGNTLLLTATPFTNSPLEIYSMLAMVAFKRLKEMQLDNLTTFFDTFVAVSYEMIINSRLRPERRQIILGFNNIISLQTLVRRFINYKTGDEVKVPRPNKIVLPLKYKMIGGLMTSLSDDEIVDTTLPLSDEQTTLMYAIKQYADGHLTESMMCSGSLLEEEESADAITAAGVEIDEDSMDADEKVGVRLLKAMNHARNLALSPYIFDCNKLGAPTYKSYIDTSNKLKYVMECIRTIKAHHAAQKTDMSGVVIYMDRGVEFFPLIREYLIKEIGFAENEVGIISSKIILPVDKGVNKEDQKEFVKNLFLGKRFNTVSLEMEDIPASDRIKVLIGSSTIKEGINLQAHSSVLFNCWLDWNPTDLQQLEGRIWRQGNKFKTVRIATPLMIDSMDIFMFQKLEEKTSRINTIWQSDGRTNVLKTEDFNPKELKYSLIKDATVLAQMILMEDAERIEEEIADLENQIKRNRKIIEYQATVDRHTSDLEEWLEQYRPANDRKRTLDAMIKLAQDVLRTKTDAEGKKMAFVYEQDKSKPSDFYSRLNPPYKPYWFDELIFANRNLLREDRDYLKPNGVQVSGLPKFSESLTKKIDTLTIEKQKVSSEEAIQQKADEINRERAESKIKPKSVQAVVKEFTKLNYLLDEVKFSDKTISVATSCPPVDAAGVVRIDSEAIAALDECLLHQPQTKRLHTVELKLPDGTIDYQYTPERQKLHQKIIADMVDKSACITQGAPVAILTGGAPGSGKSSFLKKYAQWLTSDKIFHIDADLVREKLPEYQGWNSASGHQETRDIVDQLLKSFDKPCKHDLLYDGTLTNPKKYITLIRNLKKMGYKVYIAYLDIPKEISIERALKRYQNNKGGKTKFGRYVPINVIDDFYKVGTAGLNEIKNAVDGYIVVDSLSQKIIERGGENIPKDRNYEQMFNGDNKPAPVTLTKKDYQDSLAGAKVMYDLASGQEKKDWKAFIDGLKVMIQLS